VKDIHASKFRVKYNILPAARMPHGNWYIGRVIDGADNYLHKDLTVHTNTFNKNNSMEDGYYRTQEEAQATLNAYLDINDLKEDNTNANQET